MKLSSLQSGNLWTAGQPVQFFSPIPNGVLSAQAKVTDYWGHEIYNKPAAVDANKAIISLPVLQPGWYILTLTAGALSTNCTFGITLQADKTVGLHDGKVCADAAAASELKEDQYEEFADIVKAIGLPMVRERIWWNDVEPRQGVFTWGHYDNLINAYHARGIAVDEIWHDAPEWAKARPGGGTSIPPNLEHLRGFCLEAAKHYRGRVTAWEVWNEPDNNGVFFNGTPKEFYDVMTVAYKALKEGSGGKATVLQGAMCKGVTPFAKDLFALGAGKYTDAFNWHSYEPSDNYASILSNYQQACDLGKMPTWMTEAGIFLGVSSDGELSTGDAHKQCEYVPRSVAQSLACGNAKHFFFLLPYRNENGACLGALRKDLTPNPSVIALSAAVHLLGTSTYLQTVKFEGVAANKRPIPATAVFFSSLSGGKTAVVWADEKCEMTVKGDATVPAADIKTLDIFGVARPPISNSKGLTLELGTEPVYILLPKPKSLFPFNESFSSQNDFESRWKITNNGGNANVGSGFLSLNGNGSGYPVCETLGDPFSATGNWTASFGYRYATTGNYGTEIKLLGANGEALALIHQDINGQYITVGSHQIWHVEANTRWHVVSFVQSDQKLHVFVDNATEIGSTVSNSVPCSIWIGGGTMPNPWDWNNLTLRFVRVNPGIQPLQLPALKEGPGFVDGLP